MKVISFCDMVPFVVALPAGAEDGFALFTAELLLAAADPRDIDIDMVGCAVLLSGCSTHFYLFSLAKV